MSSATFQRQTFLETLDPVFIFFWEKRIGKYCTYRTRFKSAVSFLFGFYVVFNYTSLFVSSNIYTNIFPDFSAFLEKGLAIIREEKNIQKLLMLDIC